MFERLKYGICGALLLGFILQGMWKTPPVSPYVLVGAPHAHDQHLDGKGVIVAVLDEGFDSSHFFLKDSFSSHHRYNTTNKNNQDVSESLIFENGKYCSTYNCKIRLSIAIEITYKELHWRGSCC